MPSLVRDINCRRAVALIGDYLDGALTRRDRRRLEHHLAQCGACSAYLAQMRTTIALTGSVGPEDLSPQALAALLGVFDTFHGGRGGDAQAPPSA